jgi:hypothetical protein
VCDIDCLYALLGETADALRCLKKSCAQGGARNGSSMIQIGLLLRWLREFAALLSRARRTHVAKHGRPASDRESPLDLEPVLATALVAHCRNESERVVA